MIHHDSSVHWGWGEAVPRLTGKHRMGRPKLSGTTEILTPKLISYFWYKDYK